MKDWYQISTEDVLKNMETTEQGLDEQEVSERLAEYGENILARKRQCYRYFWGSFWICWWQFLLWQR